MGPNRGGFWFPWVRLGGFFVLVVVGVNLVFLRARPLPPESDPESPDPGGHHSDYLGRKKRQLERHFRNLERFIRPAADPASGRVEGVKGDSHVLLPGVNGDSHVLLAFGGDEPEFETEGEGGDLPAAVPALIESMPVFPGLTPELLEAWAASRRVPWWQEAGEQVFGVPELLLDGLWKGARALFPAPADGSEASITSRLLDFSVEPRREPVFSEFLGKLAEREQRFFAKMGDSPLGDPAFEDGRADIDLDELADEQAKVLWDAVRKTYFSKYRFKAEEKIRDDAFYFNEWRGMDFAVLPPLMAGYVWYRGLDKKISMGDTWLRVSLEPVREWLTGGDELTAGLTVEWAPKSFPVGLVVSVGLHGGDPEVDFVGIGTSAGAVKKLLFLEEGDRR